MPKMTRTEAEGLLFMIDNIQSATMDHERCIEVNDARIIDLQNQLLEQFDGDGEPIPQKNDELAEQRPFRSQTNPDVTYFVSRWKDGSVTCTCPGFTYREHCRHVDECVNSTGWFKV